MKKFVRSLAILCLAVSAMAAHAQFNFSVSSPAENGYIGLDTVIKFLVTDAVEDVTIKVTADGPAGSTINEQTFTPNSDNEILSTMHIFFNEASEEGPYTLTIEAFDSTFNAPTIVRHVTLDVIKPRILDSNPLSGGAVKGPIVPIVVRVEEANLKEWKVKIDNADIPNNTGSTLDGNNAFQVDWNVGANPGDANHTISISVKDQAGNTATRNISIRIDRVAPSIAISFPRSDTNIRPNSDFSVIVDFNDPSNGLIDVTGVDVIIRKLDGTYLYRVPRVKFQQTGSGAFRWTGHVRKKAVNLPSQFKIVVSAVDRAGNVAVDQEVTINTGRSRKR